VTGPPSFDILPPRIAAVPVVVHVPHSATFVPADLRPSLLLSDDDLAEELLRLTDHRTDVLASDAAGHGATRFVNRWSRLVVDPERFSDPAAEEMETVGMGAVYTATSDGRPLRRPSDEGREALLERHFRPYHAAFAALVDDLIARFGSCAIVDVHSFPSEPLPYELHGDGHRPQLCIGTDPRHTPAWLGDLVAELASAKGLGVGFDTPFRGSFVPTRQLGDDRVVSVMLEIRRDTYLEETTAQPHAGEASIRELCSDVVAGVASSLEARTGRPFGAL
jgi:N-formylglutamate deformylase